MGEEFGFEVIGDERLVRRLYNTSLIRNELSVAADKAAVVVHKRAKQYPPARPSSRYRRTNTLGRRWTMQVRPAGGEVHALVSNPTEYGPYVMDPSSQAAVHRGRWATTRQILAEQKQKILGFFEYALDNIRRELMR